MTSPPSIQIHGVALAGIPMPATILTGRPSSTRITFFDDWTRRSRKRHATHTDGSPTNPGWFTQSPTNSQLPTPKNPNSRTEIELGGCCGSWALGIDWELGVAELWS